MVKENKKRYINPLIELGQMGVNKNEANKGLIYIVVILLIVLMGVIAYFQGISLFIVIPVALILILISGLRIVGNEAYYKEQVSLLDADIEQVKSKLLNISNIYEDGLVKYFNGTLSVFLCGFTNTLDDDVFSIYVEEFLNKLKNAVVDHYYFNVNDELQILNFLPKLQVYKNSPDIMKERMEFLQLQDKASKERSMLYLIAFQINTTEDFYDELMLLLEELKESQLSRDLFKRLYVADRDQVNRLIELDLRTKLDITEVTRQKFTDDDLSDVEIVAKDNLEAPEFKKVDKEEVIGNRVVYKESKKELKDDKSNNS